MEIWKKIGQYWAFVVSLILLGGIAYISVKYPDISKWWLIAVIAVSIVISFIDKLRQDKDFDDFKSKMSDGVVSREKQNQILEEQISLNKEWKEKKEVSLNLLNNLINKGLIDREEANKPFDTTQIFALYCFPTTHFITRNKEVVHKMNKRIYPEFLKNLGFIRLHIRRGLFYVIPKARLTEKLRNTFILKKYILTKINDIVIQEWASYLESVKKSHSRYVKSQYPALQRLDYKDALKFNILLMNTDISENNIGYLNDRRAFSDEFNNFIKHEIDLTKINVRRDVKGKIKNFVKSISFELFFFEEKQKDLDKLKQIEQNIKTKLNISEWGII